MPDKKQYVAFGDDGRLSHYDTGGWLGHVLYGRSPYPIEQGLEKSSAIRSILSDTLGNKDYFITAYGMSQMNAGVDTSPSIFEHTQGIARNKFVQFSLLNSTFETGGKYLTESERRNFYRFFSGLKMLSLIGPKLPDLVLSTLYYACIRLGDRAAQSKNPMINYGGRFLFTFLLGGSLALLKTVVRPITSTAAALFSPITAGLGLLYGIGQYIIGDTNVKPRIIWDGFIEGLKTWGGDLYNAVIPQSKVVKIDDNKNKTVKETRISNFATATLCVAVGIVTGFLLANPIGLGLAALAGVTAGLMGVNIFNSVKHAINDIRHWGKRDKIHDWGIAGTAYRDKKTPSPKNDSRKTNQVIPVNNPKPVQTQPPVDTTKSWDVWVEAVNRVAEQQGKVGIKVPIAGMSVMLEAQEYFTFSKSMDDRALPTHESSKEEIETTLKLVEKALKGLASEIPSPASVMKHKPPSPDDSSPGGSSHTPRPTGGS